MTTALSPSLWLATTKRASTCIDPAYVAALGNPSHLVSSIIPPTSR